MATDALSRLYAPPPDTKEIPDYLPAELRVWPEERTSAWWRAQEAPRGAADIGYEQDVDWERQ